MRNFHCRFYRICLYRAAALDSEDFDCSGCEFEKDNYREFTEVDKIGARALLLAIVEKDPRLKWISARPDLGG
jgi:hypothetical protein